MSEVNKATVGKIYDIINTGNLAQVNEVIASDAIEHEQMPGLTGTGAELFKHFVTVFRAAFPDLKISAEDMIAEGEKVAVRFTLSGTHRGDFMGMPASGKQVSVPSIDIVRIANGKAVEVWHMEDTMGMMQQLGAIPS